MRSLSTADTYYSIELTVNRNVRKFKNRFYTNNMNTATFVVF